MGKQYAAALAIKAVAQLVEEWETRQPRQLCRHLGITIYDCADFSELKAMYALVDERPCIFLKSALAPPLRSFVLAHELGHALLHQELLSRNRAILDGSLFDLSSSPELEANYFAAELILVDEGVLELLAEGYTLGQIAQNSCCPVEAVELKLQLLQHKGHKLKYQSLLRSDFLKRL